MKIFRSKKTQAVISNFIFWMFYVIAIGITSVTIFSIGNFFVASASEIPDKLEEELILIPRFYSSENCFAYKDESGRVYIRIIDLEKFEQVTMEKCYPDSNVKYAFSLSLDVPEIDVDTPRLNSFNWVEEHYSSKKLSEDVFVLYNGVQYKGELKIAIKDAE